MEPKRPLFPIYDIMEHWAAFAHCNPDVKPQHHALYHALVYMSKRLGGSTRFNLSYMDGMKASGIGSRNTYTATLKELQAWGFATYEPGANGLKSPVVAALFCASTEHQLSIYRASTCASADTSAEHIIKEVKRLKVEGEEKSAALAEALADIELLKAELAELTESPNDHRPTIVAVPPAAPMAADKAAAIATTNPDDEILWSDGPLSRPESFKIMCCRSPLGKTIAHEYYRQIALALAESKGISRTITQWESWIFKFLENHKPKGGQLLTPADIATELQTGVRAPQHHNAPDHKPRPEVAAKRAADFEAQKQLKIAANLARNAADGLSQQTQPGGIARGF